MTIHVPLTLSPESPTAFTLECEGRKLVHFQETGKRARLLDGNPEMFARHDLLRWAAPFALAAQGLVCLHASGVHKEGTRIGFLGIGGAGKSTWAWELSKQGWQPFADDLMVCDAAGRVNVLAERTLRQWCQAQAVGRGRIEDRGSRIEDFREGEAPAEPFAERLGRSLALPVRSPVQDQEAWIDYSDLAERLADAGNQQWLPLSGLCFLPETRGVKLAIHPLSPGDQFGRLARYGFGGLPAAEAWVHQFQVYATLAHQVPAALLQVPEGLDELRSALTSWEDHLSQWLDTFALARI